MAVESDRRRLRRVLAAALDAAKREAIAEASVRSELQDLCADYFDQLRRLVPERSHRVDALERAERRRTWLDAPAEGPLGSAAAVDLGELAARVAPEPGADTAAVLRAYEIAIDEVLRRFDTWRREPATPEDATVYAWRERLGLAWLDGRERSAKAAVEAEMITWARDLAEAPALASDLRATQDQFVPKIASTLPEGADDALRLRALRDLHPSLRTSPGVIDIYLTAIEEKGLNDDRRERLNEAFAAYRAAFEAFLPRVEAARAAIVDPVAHETWRLDEARRRVFRVGDRRPAPPPGREALNDVREAWRAKSEPLAAAVLRAARAGKEG